MRLKTFKAQTLSLAMAHVHEELGDHAIIVSSRTGSDEDGVTVMAAIESQPPEGSDQDGADALSVVDEMLQFHRTPEEVSGPLLTAAKELLRSTPTLTSPLAVLAGAIDMRCSFRALAPDSFSGPLILLGPPGAGKTVACAKIAAAATLSGKKARFVSMDTARAGSAARLGTLAEKLSIRFDEASDRTQLESQLSHYPDEAVIVDTPGFNPFDEDDVEILRSLVADIATPILLVLPAGTDAFEAAEQAKIFASLGATGLLASRLDAAVRYGGILAAARAGNLPIVAATIHPQIGEGLIALNPIATSRLLAARFEGASSPFAGLEAAS